jgi:hypothetical protein
VGYHRDLGRVRAVDVKQPRPGRPRHRDDRAGGVDDVLEDRALPRGRLREDGVQHHDARHPQRVEQRHEVLAVEAAVDAVLVLDNRDIEAVQHLERGRRAPAGPVHEVMHDLGPGPRQGLPGPGLVENADHACVIAWPAQVSEQRGAEGREPALRRRIGAEQRVRPAHNAAARAATPWPSEWWSERSSGAMIVKPSTSAVPNPRREARRATRTADVAGLTASVRSAPVLPSSSHTRGPAGGPGRHHGPF